MLRVLSAFLAVVSVVLGVYVWQLSSEASALRDQLATTKKEAETARADVTAVRQQLDAARQAEDKTAVAESKGSDQTGQPGALSANAGPKTKPSDNPMAKMFESEEGKKMMKTQMAMVAKMQYRDLARLLNLSPEQADKVMALLAERTATLAGNPWKFMSEGKIDPEQIKKMGEENEATRKNYDAMLKNELGEQGFQQFQDYEKTIGERMALSQIEPQFGGNPLQQDQRDKLLQLMADERKNSPPSPFDPTGRDVARNMQAMADDGAVDAFLKQEDDYHKRIVQQAGSILTAEQVKSLEQGFTQLGEMQKFGIKMGMQMMKSGIKPAGGAPK